MAAPSMSLFSRMRTFAEQASYEKFCLKFNDEALDEHLEGGLTAGLFEIAGEAGCGKSQIAMHLTAQCLMDDHRVVYVNTEGKFPLNRVEEIIRETSGTLNGNKLLIREVNDFDVLVDILHRVLENTVKKWMADEDPVKLIVVDSIGNLARFTEDYIGRAKNFYYIVKRLIKLAELYDIIILLINQVSDVFPEDIRFHESWNGSVISDGRRVTPTLGVAWTNLMSTRLLLSRTKIPHGNDYYFRRYLHIAFSAFIPDKQPLEFQICNAGVYTTES